MKRDCKQFIEDVVQVVSVLAVYSILVFGMVFGLAEVSEKVRAGIKEKNDLVPDTVDVDAGVGRVEFSDVPVYAAGTNSEEKEAELHKIEIYREGDGPAPDWYRPDEPMSVVWEAPDAVSDEGSIGSKARGEYIRVWRREACS